jgi:hypothetical protein
MASMEGANMSQARLDRASLIRARLNGANLSLASMGHADLFRANLEGANLGSADLRDVNAIEANLVGANLQHSTVTGASFSGALIKHADFRHTVGLTKEMVLQCRDWQLAFFDPDMLKQLGLPPDHNEKLQKQMEAEQKTKAAATAPLGAAPLSDPKAKP